MPAGRFESLSYAPYRAWQSPLDKDYPTGAQVAQDLALVATRAKAIRTYSAIEGNYDMGTLARQAGLKLWLGIWLGTNPAQNAREMAAGIAQANAHPNTIIRVVVGNEVLLRRDLSVQDLIADIDYVHARVKQPVAYADVPHFWREFPQVAQHVDIVMVHILPYWQNHPLGVQAAIDSIQGTISSFRKLFPGKVICIGETGWPSRGRWRGPAAPSRVNEAVFLREFVTLARQEGVQYNLIESFDQVWKYQDEGVAGANWGIWNAQREPKFPLNGPVTERPDWPWYATLGVLAAWLLYGAAGFGGFRLVLASFALGNGLAIACMGTLPLLYDHWLELDALVNLPLQLIFAALAVRRAAAVLRGEPVPPVTSGAMVLAGLRRGRLRLDYGSLWFIFLASAAIFEAMLVFDGRYRAAPMAVFIIPVIAALMRFSTRDKPRQMGWEELLAAYALAILAIADSLIEGSANLQFVAWNLAALVLAAPVIMATDSKKGARRSRALNPRRRGF